MYAFTSHELPADLRDGYRRLVQGFGHTSSRCAPGPGCPSDATTAATFAQSLWRFCDNRRVAFPALIAPLIQRVRDEMPTSGVLLAIADWSTLAFPTHASKTDRRQLTHAQDIGYDLATVLLVRGSDGAPLAPVSVSLTTDTAVLSTRPEPVADLPHIDQIRPQMDFVASLAFDRPVVHVIDREADSVGHWRNWTAAGYWALVRADDRVVRHAGRERKLVAVADELRATGGLVAAGEVRYRGRRAWRYVGEAAVVLHRPAKRRENGRQRDIPGPPLPLRLVVAELRDDTGRVLARWLLLTNVPVEHGDAATVATWYYWRWRIESLHKLLKSGGWELESWLQRNGPRLLRKLLVALAAVTEVWALERRDDAASTAFKTLLVRLSGRQTKRRRPITTTALLAGLWVMQQAAGWLRQDGPDDPNTLLQQHLPLFATCVRQNE